MSKNTQLTPDDAKTLYNQLTTTEQIIIQFLSILLESINRTHLANHLREAGVRK